MCLLLEVEQKASYMHSHIDTLNDMHDTIERQLKAKVMYKLMCMSMTYISSDIDLFPKLEC